MEINYNWTINPLEAYPTASGETDVVFVAHWQFHATTGSYSASSIGTQSLIYSSGSAFTSFNDLTLEQVTGWVTGAMEAQNSGSVDRMKEGLAAQIANQINPPSVTLTSPWLNVTTTSTTTTTTTLEG
jgi:hypothetical protein